LRNPSKTDSSLVFQKRGVFAVHDIKKGEILEYAPVIPLSASEWISVSGTTLRYYCYTWGKDKGKTGVAIALGYGSLYNCSPKPSAYPVNFPTKQTIGFYAAKNIEMGEEITVNRPGPGSKGHFAVKTAGIAGRFGAVVEVRTTRNKGRGIFALQPIAGGELIERAPALFIPTREWSCLQNTILDNYCFRIGPNQEHTALAMGFGSLYNHSYTPNAVYAVKDQEMIVQFNALRDIRPGEEITVNYNRDPRDRSPVWFDVLP
jgi:SET domain-containing protein